MPGSVRIHTFLQHEHDRGGKYFMGLMKEKKNCLKVFVERKKGMRVSPSRTHRTSQNWEKLRDSKNSGKQALAYSEMVEGRHLSPVCRNP